MNNRAAALVQASRGPLLLMLLGFLFALQQSGTLAFSRSWPLLIIAIGCMKLAERMVAGPNASVMPAVGVPPSQQSPYQAGYVAPSQRPGGGQPPRGTF